MAVLFRRRIGTATGRIGRIGSASVSTAVTAATGRIGRISTSTVAAAITAATGRIGRICSASVSTAITAAWRVGRISASAMSSVSTAVTAAIATARWFGRIISALAATLTISATGRGRRRIVAAVISAGRRRWGWIVTTVALISVVGMVIIARGIIIPVATVTVIRPAKIGLQQFCVVSFQPVIKSGRVIQRRNLIHPEIGNEDVLFQGQIALAHDHDADHAAGNAFLQDVIFIHQDRINRAGSRAEKLVLFVEIYFRLLGQGVHPKSAVHCLACQGRKTEEEAEREQCFCLHGWLLNKSHIL